MDALLYLVAVASGAMAIVSVMVSSPDYRLLLLMAVVSGAVAACCAVLLIRRGGNARLGGILLAGCMSYVAWQLVTRMPFFFGPHGD